MKKIALFLLVMLHFGCHGDQNGEYQHPIQNGVNVRYTVESKEFKKSYTWDFQRKIRTFKLVSTTELGIRAKQFIVDNNSLIMSDIPHSQLVFFNKENEMMKKIGKKGDAPDEIKRLYYFSVFHDTIILHDFGQRRHKRFVKDAYLDDERIGGSVSYSGKFLSPSLFYEYISIDRNEHILFKKFKDNNSIVDYDLKELFKLADSKIINSTGNDFSVVVSTLLFGQFSVSKSTSNNIFYLSNAGYFANFDNRGNLKYVKQTIDKTPFPYGTMKDLGGGIKIPKKFPYAYIFLSGTNNDKHFYLLNLINQPRSEKIMYSVDYYNINDGGYDGSFNVPYYKEQAPQVISVSPNDKYLYVYYEDLTLCKYEIR